MSTILGFDPQVETTMIDDHAKLLHLLVDFITSEIISRRKSAHRSIHNQNDEMIIENMMCRRFKSFMSFLAENSKFIVDLVEDNVIAKLKSDFNVQRLSEFLDYAKSNLSTLNALRSLQEHAGLRQKNNSFDPCS